MKSNSQLFTYNAEDFKFAENLTDTDFKIDPSDGNMRWVNFHGFDHKVLLQNSFETFGVHKLTREDILQLTERPKIEEYEHYIYITLKSVYTSNSIKHRIKSEQISFILTENTLISYQERHGDLFGYIRERLTQNTGIVRKKGADYLLYLLIEATLLGYEKCLEEVNLNVKKLNDCLRNQSSNELFASIEECKDEMQLLRKSFHPFKEQIQKLANATNPLIKESTLPFFNDIRDNVLYIADELDETKETLESLTNLYFARLSQKSNEIMQFLTIVTAIFIPLTFLVGVYGMNFKYMPELSMKYGYYIVWGIMVVVAVFLVIYFKKKKWF